MGKNKINVLLTGASGTVGSEVLIQLANRDDISFSIFDKKTDKAEKFLKKYSSKANIVYGDITNIKEVENIAKNQDIVIHLAALIPPIADKFPKLAYLVNVLGTANLVSALEKHSPNAFFMYSSSVSVYGDRVDNPNISTKDALNPSVGDEYAKTKIESEKLIQNSKLNWTIYRLAAIMKNHKVSELMFHMPLETTMEICTPEDTARAFVNGIFKQKELSKRIFNLGGGKECTISYKKFLQKSFFQFGLGKLNFKPNTFAKINFHCGYYVDGEDLEKITNFRQDNLETYFEKTKTGISFINKFFAQILRYPIKKYLQSKSEPLKAIKENDKALIKRFFGDKLILS